MTTRANTKRIAEPLRLAAAMLFLALSATSALCYTSPIALTNTQGLIFGAFVAGTGGTVTLNTLGIRSMSGDIVLLSASPTAHAATFNVSGDAHAQYSITLPANGAVSLSGPGASMALSNFTSNPASSATLGAGGTGTIAVGATLTVGNGQTPGSYSGSFQVTVTYQ